jgi:uncharacterized surface protein with fasciclin (FAS1) repeats
MIMLQKALFASIAGLGLAFSAPTDAQDSDIVDIAVGAGSFDTLVAALQAADLVDVLRGDGPFTVFAPTDDAFAALPDGTLETLLDPANKDLLVSILTYHVVAGSVLAADVVNLDSAPTVQGESVRISVTNAGVQVDAANVVQTDIIAANGVIHVIDAVILPGTNATAVDASGWGTVKGSIR